MGCGASVDANGNPIPFMESAQDKKKRLRKEKEQKSQAEANDRMIKYNEEWMADQFGKYLEDGVVKKPKMPGEAPHNDGFDDDQNADDLRAYERVEHGTKYLLEKIDEREKESKKCGVPLPPALAQQRERYQKMRSDLALYYKPWYRAWLTSPVVDNKNRRDDWISGLVKNFPDDPESKWEILGPLAKEAQKKYDEAEKKQSDAQEQVFENFQKESYKLTDRLKDILREKVKELQPAYEKWLAENNVKALPHSKTIGDAELSSKSQFSFQPKPEDKLGRTRTISPEWDTEDNDEVGQWHYSISDDVRKAFQAMDSAVERAVEDLYNKTFPNGYSSRFAHNGIHLGGKELTLSGALKEAKVETNFHTYKEFEPIDLNEYARVHGKSKAQELQRRYSFDNVGICILEGGRTHHYKSDSYQMKVPSINVTAMKLKDFFLVWPGGSCMDGVDPVAALKQA